MAVAIAWLPGPAGTRRRVAKPSVEEPDAAEPARPDLWGARVSNDPGLPDLLDARGIVCSMSRRGNCHDNAVMESFFSTVKSELAERFDTYGDAKMELFDFIEVFYNQQRRHSTLGQISPAAFERRANEEGVEPMENRQGRGFPQAPHPLSFSMRKEQTTRNDQLNETVR